MTIFTVRKDFPHDPLEHHAVATIGQILQVQADFISSLSPSFRDRLAFADPLVRSYLRTDDGVTKCCVELRWNEPVTDQELQQACWPLPITEESERHADDHTK